MFVKEENVIMEGNQVIQRHYGTDKDNITAVVTIPVSDPVLPNQERDISGEEIQAQILLNQADIIAKQQEQDEVLAEMLLQQTVKQQEQDEVLAAILLNQMKGGEGNV